MHDNHPILAQYTPISLEKDGFFKLPDLTPADPAEEPESTVEDFEDPTPTEVELQTEHDVWLESAAPRRKQTAFRTWETFKTGNLEPSAAIFLSEAGRGAYDAMLALAGDPLHMQNSETPVVDTKTYFSSVLSFSLGRESVFFTRDSPGGEFKNALEEFRVSGYSRQVLQGLEKQAAESGAAFVQLTAFSRSGYSRASSRCSVAFASAVGQILQAVESWITVDGQNPRSLLQLEATIQRAMEILRPLRALVSRLPRLCTDEQLLDLVFEEASLLDFGERYVRDMLCEILRRVSAPWIETIEGWMGTRAEAGLPFTKADVGKRKGFVTVEATTFTDDFGREVEVVDFCLDETSIPRFLPLDVAKTIFESGKNLRAIKSFHPDHPLAQQVVVASCQPPQAEWQFNWDSISKLEERVADYRERIVRAVEDSRSRRLPIAIEAQRNLSNEAGNLFKWNFFGVDSAVMEQTFLHSLQYLSQPPDNLTIDNDLNRIVKAKLSGSNQTSALDSDATPHWSLVPLVSFGGIAFAQSRIVNQESLRLLFDTHDLQTHLQLQREFQLLGNGLFCSRLSHALFDTDLETAERRAGVAMSGGVMGLRLGGRDTWPPASSELRLALMGVLTESYTPKAGGTASEPVGASGGSHALPGDLSFAVRDLSEEEIEKCMDADSLEALDFLRLSYTTPPELASIITPIHLMHYDRIFKLLLRTQRMLYIVNQLYRDSSSRANTWLEENASYRFVREAQHFLSGIASYFWDSGIAIPWKSFDQKLTQVRETVQTLDSGAQNKAYSPEQLCGMHTAAIDRMMFALFLRQRQLPILNVLEDIFSIILRYAKFVRLLALGREDEAGDNVQPAGYYDELKDKIQLFIAVCRGLSEKERAGIKRTADVAFDELGMGDDSLVAQLVTRLDLTNYYG